MSQMQFEDTNKRKTGKRKTLFFSLAVCLLALGAGTWSVLDSMSREQTVRPDQQTAKCGGIGDRRADCSAKNPGADICAAA